MSREPIWGWAALGLGGSALTAISGSRLVDVGLARWWFAPRIHPGQRATFYLGVAVISLAWLGLGRRLTAARPPDVRRLWLIAAAWCAPLVVGPILFSYDVYSYLAQGEILHLGLNPYHDAPVVLGKLGQSHMLAAVSPFWRRTTAPYGPLFLQAIGLIAGLTGAKLVASALLIRFLELGGVILLAGFVPRLARTQGADPVRATWLMVLSPLVMLELVAAAHNDALLVGLMVGGVTLAAERRPLAGILVCAVAATIKLPAIVAVIFIAVAWAWESRDRLKVLGQSALAALAVGLAVSAVSGTGFSWVSPSLVSTPQKVHLAITPATGLGWTLAWVLHALGVPVNAHHLESAIGVVAFALVGVIGVLLLWRTRIETMVRDLGVTLVAAALCGPALWPWYLIWGGAMLAVVPSTQRSRVLPAVAVISVFLVKPNGVLALPLPSAPAVVAVYALIAGAVGYAWLRRRRDDGRYRLASPRLSDRGALVESQ